MNKVRRDAALVAFRQRHVRLGLAILLMPEGWSLAKFPPPDEEREASPREEPQG